MHRVALALGILLPASASANDSKVERMLKQLDPDARFEQICDLEAARRIGEDKSYRPERAVVSALLHRSSLPIVLEPRRDAGAAEQNDPNPCVGSTSVSAGSWVVKSLAPRSVTFWSTGRIAQSAKRDDRRSCVPCWPRRQQRASARR